MVKLNFDVFQHLILMLVLFDFMIVKFNGRSFFASILENKMWNIKQK